MNCNAIKVELVRGCSRRCDFCAINTCDDISGGELHFMSASMSQEIANQISEHFKDKIRIEFSLHGEPLLNPNVAEIIGIFRNKLPMAQISLITNGDPIHKNGQYFLDSLFANGLNNLMVDFYDKGITKRNEKVLEYINKASDYADILNYYKDKVHIWAYKSYKNRSIIVTGDIVAHTGEDLKRKIHSVAGNLPLDIQEQYGIKQKDLPKKTRCGRPFREMTIAYNGDVLLCCNDWKHKVVVGKIEEENLYEIWNGDYMNSLRYMLYNKRRDLINICKVCSDIGGFRLGFLKVDKEYPELI